MGLRYRQRVKLFPGVHLNLSLRSVSVSFGGPGATVNIGKGGTTKGTIGLPGTGLSYQHRFKTESLPSENIEFNNKIIDNSDKNINSINFRKNETSIYSSNSYGVTKFESKSIETLENSGMKNLKDIIESFISERSTLEKEVYQLQLNADSTKKKADSTNNFFNRIFNKEKIKTNADIATDASIDLKNAKEDLQRLVFPITWNITDELNEQYTQLCNFISEKNFVAIWRVNFLKQIDKVSLRAAYDSVVDRTPAYLTLKWPEIFPHDGKYSLKGAPCLWSDGNARIYLLPSFVLVINDNKYAIIDPKDLKVIENEDGDMPEDHIVEESDLNSQLLVVGEAWKYSNKDGSRDGRFKNNIKESIVRYDRLEIKTNTGLHERFLFAKNGIYIKYALTNYIYWFKNFEKITKTLDIFPSSRTINGKWNHSIQEDKTEIISYQVSGENDWLVAFLVPNDKSGLHISFALDTIGVPFMNWLRMSIFADDNSLLSNPSNIKRKDTITLFAWKNSPENKPKKEWFDDDPNIWKKILTSKTMTVFLQDCPENFFLEIEDSVRYKEFGYCFPLDGLADLFEVVFPSFCLPIRN